MDQLEYFAKTLNMVYDSLAAPPRKLCDACLNLYEEHEGREVMTDFGKEWWCKGCEELAKSEGDQK